jgi:hypothetical protein
MKRKLYSLALTLSVILVHNVSFTQVKVSPVGALSVGSATNPFTYCMFRVVGGYSQFCENTGIPTSSPMIRGRNSYSVASAPDFTWWGNDQTGIFHPSVDVIGFSIGGSERVRIASTSYRLTVLGSALASGGLWTNSDIRFKTNISTISNSLEKLNQINGVKYTYLKNDQTKQYGLDQETGEVFGFIAQDLGKVFPEMVKIDDNGFYAVNYSMLVPVLVEALKTQNTQISDLQNRLNQLESKSSDEKPAGSGQIEAKLFQNSPNPFTERTIIKYFIPENASNASIIIIYDLNGHQLKKVDRLEKGNGEITLNASELPAGTYYYTLIVENTEIDTKKLIIVQ